MEFNTPAEARIRTWQRKVKKKEEFLVPKNLTEAKELVNNLSIEDLRTFRFTFPLGQD